MVGSESYSARLPVEPLYSLPFSTQLGPDFLSFMLTGKVDGKELEKSPSPHSKLLSSHLVRSIADVVCVGTLCAKYPSLLKPLEVRVDAVQFEASGRQKHNASTLHFSTTFLCYASKRFEYPVNLILEGLSRADWLAQDILGEEWAHIVCGVRRLAPDRFHVHPAMWFENARTITLCPVNSPVSGWMFCVG
jgi:hypothetical protein